MTSTSSLHPVRRVLVIANETLATDDLHHVLTAHAGRTEVLLVAPATFPADAATDDRLAAALAALDAANVHVSGWVGAPDPIHAIADALTIFAADEILVATHPTGRSPWVAQDLVARACGRFGLPVVHLVAQPAPARALALVLVG
jgi:hypothetical protein